jgi:hypothetical protein
LAAHVDVAAAIGGDLPAIAGVGADRLRGRGRGLRLARRHAQRDRQDLGPGAIGEVSVAVTSIVEPLPVVVTVASRPAVLATPTVDPT